MYRKMTLNTIFIRQLTTIKKLSGKTAIVTASTDGIGFAIARRLAEDGANVMISSRKESNVSKALESLRGLSVSGVTCHVAKAEDRKRLIFETLDKYSCIDFLVSNAAVNPVYGSILDVSEEAWSKIFDINVKTSFLLSKEIVPHIKERKGGAITFVSSIGGFNPIPYIGAYSVSKTALIGLTKALSLELAADNIRVNCVAPGIVATKFSSALTENKEVRDQILNSIPLKRFGNATDIAGPVSFLCSDDASYITGETIVIAGGSTSRL